MRRVIRPAARADIIRQYRFYLLEEAFDAADRFLNAVNATIVLISQNPNIGSPKTLRKSKLPGLRIDSKPLHG